MNPSQRDIPQREHSHLDLSRETLDNSAGLEDRLCPGCKKSAVSEQGGLVVAFGQSFFHVDCFKCAKCGDQVTADTNLLLLSDGSPICANCSYSCNICHLPILDEAIMTGDDSYHAHCFKCKVCKSRIDELVFAKTSQGIYCMNCHNERMIKIRKHTQKKAEREKAAGGSGSTKSREREARSYHRDNGATSPSIEDRPDTSRSQGLHSSTGSRPSSSRGPDPSTSMRSPARAPPGPYVSDAFEFTPLTSTSNVTLHPSHEKLSSQSATISPTLNSEHIPQLEPYPPKFGVSLDQDRLSLVKQNTLPIPFTTVDRDVDGRRRSYDDGVRPLNILFGRKGDVVQHADVPVVVPASETLTVSTSFRDKRRSINPAFLPSDFNAPATTSIHTPSLSPHSTSFQGQQPIARTSTPPVAGGRESPHVYSPLRENFYVPSSSRPTSHSSSRLSNSTLYSTHHSPSVSQEPSRSPSPSQDETVVINRSPHSAVVASSIPPKSPLNGGFNIDVVHQKEGGPSPSLNSKTNKTLRDQTLFDDRQGLSSRPNSGNLSHHSLTRKRSVSPAYRADVPHSVESETDTEPEVENNDQQLHSRTSIPPIPPPKEEKDFSSRVNETVFVPNDMDQDPLTAPQPDSGSDDMSESSPVERTSHSTFIVPALPPIRFSMNTADFSELFNVGEGPSLKSLDDLASISEDDFPKAFTPPPTALPDMTPGGHNTAEISHYETTEVVYDLDNLLNDDHKSNCSSTTLEVLIEPHQLTLPSDPPNSDRQTILEPVNPIVTLNGSKNVTLTGGGSTIGMTLGHDTTNTADIITSHLRELITDGGEHGAQQLTLDKGFVEDILITLESHKTEYQRLSSKFDGIRRTSMQYIEGLTVAQTEYDRELKARRDAEAEVTRLRVLLSGQVARLTALSGDTRKEELRQQLSKELNDNLSGLERDLSKLKVERDMTLAEVEELSATKSSPELPPTNLGRSLTKRLETIKTQYKRDLVPLTQERETLTREIAELKAVRDVFLEETTVLNARNEELARLSAVYSRRMEGVTEHPSKSDRDSHDKIHNHAYSPHQAIPPPPSLSPSTSGSSNIHDDSSSDPKYIGIRKLDTEHTPSKAKFMKWPGSKTKEVLSPPADRKVHLEHNFQQLSVLRFTRCDHCGDKMWGSQLRCTVCSTSIHVRCVGHLQAPCAQQPGVQTESTSVSLPPSMFGRDLVEQVHADSKDEERHVPIIVEKCIDAVETLALDYEGIYRKTGGSGQSKAIMQLFERGDYMSFDLRDSNRFNDICSVTSVLKSYFRSLPIPLLTYDLHDQFMSAVHIRDPAIKHTSLLELVNKLPNEHYYTLRMLMLHLNHVQNRCEKNLMNARNLGVVFGPTLMRSRDPAAEFSDMAGKALSVEWLVENAPFIFSQTKPN